MFVLGFLGGSWRRMYISPSPRPVTFSPRALSGEGKQLWRPPGGAGVDVEVATSAQLSKERRGREGRLQTPRKGRELYSDCSKRPRRFPFRALARLGSLWPVPPPEPPRRRPPPPLLLFPFPPPPCPSPHPSLLSAGVLRAPLRKRRGKPRKPQGTETWEENVLSEKAKSCAQLGEKKFVAACFVPAQTPAQTPARGKGFLPLALVWAAGLELETEGDCRLRVRPRGKPSHQSVICGWHSGDPSHPAPETQKRRLQAPRAHACSWTTFLKCRQHTPAARGGEFNHLCNRHVVPKTSRCAHLS